jgi:hypothetical protein
MKTLLTTRELGDIAAATAKRAAVHDSTADSAIRHPSSFPVGAALDHATIADSNRTLARKALSLLAGNKGSFGQDDIELAATAVQVARNEVRRQHARTGVVGRSVSERLEGLLIKLRAMHEAAPAYEEY